MKIEKVITNSELAAFKNCRRKWAYTYCYGRVAPRSEAMNLGIEIHELLETYFTTGKEIEGEEKAQSIARNFVESKEAGALKNDVDFSSALLEEELFLELSPYAGIRGKLDVYDPKNNVLLDWKTSGQLWSEDQLWRSDQLRTYSLMIREKYKKTPKVMVACIRSVDPEHKSSKPPYYKILTLPLRLSDDGKFPEELLDEHKVRLASEAEELLRNKELAASGERIDRPTFSRMCSYCHFSSACDLAIYSPKAQEWAALVTHSEDGDPNARYEK